MKVIQTILLALIIIGTGLIFTQNLWVPPLVTYILEWEGVHRQAEEAANQNGKLFATQKEKTKMQEKEQLTKLLSDNGNNPISDITQSASASSTYAKKFNIPGEISFRQVGESAVSSDSSTVVSFVKGDSGEEYEIDIESNSLKDTIMRGRERISVATAKGELVITLCEIDSEYKSVRLWVTYDKSDFFNTPDDFAKDSSYCPINY